MRVKSQERRVESRATVRCPWSVVRCMRIGNGPRTTDHGLGSRPALTLIELLVVIIILVTLVAAALPVLAPSSDERRIREASRGVNAFISGAQTRAIQLQRPFGVALKKLSQDTEKGEDNSVCVELFYVEQPPAFTGFDEASAVRVSLDPDPDAPPGQVLLQFVRRGSTTGAFLPAGLDFDQIPPGMIRPGDVVEAGGTRYELVESGGSEPNPFDDSGFYTPTIGEPDGTLAARPVNDTGQLVNFVRRELDTSPPLIAARVWSEPIRFKILRQPMPTSAEPYQLPKGTAIDLRASGVGDDDYYYVPGIHDNQYGPVIMFAPEGSVSRVIFSREPDDSEAFDEPVVHNLYLLVGRRENCPPSAPALDKTLSSGAYAGLTTDEQRQEVKQSINWLRGDSRWVVIGAQSGRVVTTENAFVDPLAVIAAVGTSNLEVLRNGQLDAAREFAREMRQMGGR